MTTIEHQPTQDVPRTRDAWQRPLLVFVAFAAAYMTLRQLFYVTVGPPWAEFSDADLGIYLGSVRSVVDGKYLYDLIPAFTYPPFALAVFAPIAWIPLGLIGPVLQFVKIVILMAGVWVYLGRRETPVRRRVVWSVVAVFLAVMLIETVGDDMFSGQVNLLLLVLVLADLLRPARERWRGIGVGIAAGIKLVPGLFIIYLLVTRQFRAAGVATAAFLATVVAGFALQPSASWHYWTSVLWDSSRVWPRPDIVLNQTVRGITVRALGHDNEAIWVTLAVLVIIAGTALAVALHGRGQELAALTAVGLTAAAVTPQGWLHHWVWFAPAMLIIASGMRRSVGVWAGVLALFLLIIGRFHIAITWDPWNHDALHLSAAQQVLAASHPIALVGLGVYTVIWLRTTRQRVAASAESTQQ
ncbi:glycosyltransferase 87 family protein [Micromonospora sp. NPDC048839]|uniref:glycosyltransferase 87 family protein n=1 Tax=Micromonospora sp. NPDC048839 TaxID=3155641 RepID=UPI0033D5ECC9